MASKTESKRVATFNSKIEALEKETGYKYEILMPNIEKFIEENRLFASWFWSGAPLAKVSFEGKTLMFKIDGSLKARLVDTEGKIETEEFEDFIPPVEGIIRDDKDIEALTSGENDNGYKLEIEGDNKVILFIEEGSEDPVVFEDPSIARCILNKEAVVDLMTKDASSSAPSPADVAVKDRLPDKNINDALDAALEQIEGNAGIELPERPSVPEEKGAVEDKGDIPTFEEYAKTPEGKAEIKAKKEEKKTAKKETKAVKKTAKTENTATGDVLIRYDLLPLDFISVFIEMFEEENSQEVSFLHLIESFKNEEATLMESAVAYAQANYATASEAVTDMAKVVTKEAEEAGSEDTWKSCDVTACINKALAAHISNLNSEERHSAEILWSLMAGAWAASNS